MNQAEPSSASAKPFGGSTEHVSDPAERRSLRSAAMLTAGVGIAFSVLFMLAFWLMSTTPGPRAPDAEITDFYASSEHRRLILVGLYIMPFAGMAFVWFIVALRMWISRSNRREDILLSNIQLVSGIVFVALFFASAATTSASATSVEFSGAAVDPELARQLPLYGNALMMVFAVRMAAMFVFATSNIARASHLLPRWFTVGGLVVGLFMLLSVSFTPVLVLAFPVWMLCLCALLLRRARHIPRDLTLDAAPAGATMAPW
jgi:Na+-transporting methylmalonyl-CoA/oxaloacetate decarboxylase gamma subunit